MATIWKFTIDTKKHVGEEEIYVGGRVIEILHAGLDPDGVPCVWVLVNDNGIPSHIVIHVYGTGREVPMEVMGRHIGSFNEGEFVHHIFGWRL